MVHRAVQHENEFVSTKALFRRGLELLGHDIHQQLQTCTRTMLDRFRTGFGVGPKALAACFHELQRSNVAKARVPKPQLDYKE